MLVSRLKKMQREKKTADEIWFEQNPILDEDDKSNRLLMFIFGDNTVEKIDNDLDICDIIGNTNNSGDKRQLKYDMGLSRYKIGKDNFAYSNHRKKVVKLSGDIEQNPGPKTGVSRGRTNVDLFFPPFSGGASHEGYLVMATTVTTTSGTYNIDLLDTVSLISMEGWRYKDLKIVRDLMSRYRAYVVEEVRTEVEVTEGTEVGIGVQEILGYRQSDIKQIILKNLPFNTGLVAKRITNMATYYGNNAEYFSVYNKRHDGPSKGVRVVIGLNSEDYVSYKIVLAVKIRFYDISVGLVNWGPKKGNCKIFFGGWVHETDGIEDRSSVV